MSRAPGGAAVLDDHVRAELAALADVLAPLDAEGWRTPSLCEGWTVREVVAHLTLPARRSTPSVLAGLALSGFRWHVFADKAARRDGRLSTDALLSDLRSTRLSAWRPPGGAADSALVHALVHALDVTVPLSSRRRRDPQRFGTVLQALVAPASLKHFGVVLDGVELCADDGLWSHGTGRRVTASSEALVLVLSGRAPLPG